MRHETSLIKKPPKVQKTQPVSPATAQSDLWPTPPWTNVAPHHPPLADGGDWNRTKPIMKVVQLPARSRDKTCFSSSAGPTHYQPSGISRRASVVAAARQDKADRTRDRHLEAFIDRRENAAQRQWRKPGKYTKALFACCFLQEVFAIGLQVESIFSHEAMTCLSYDHSRLESNRLNSTPLWQ